MSFSAKDRKVGTLVSRATNLRHRCNRGLELAADIVSPTMMQNDSRNAPSRSGNHDLKHLCRHLRTRGRQRKGSGVRGERGVRGEGREGGERR